MAYTLKDPEPVVYYENDEFEYIGSSFLHFERISPVELAEYLGLDVNYFGEWADDNWIGTYETIEGVVAELYQFSTEQLLSFAQIRYTEEQKEMERKRRWYVEKYIYPITESLKNILNHKST